MDEPRESVGYPQAKANQNEGDDQRTSGMPPEPQENKWVDFLEWFDGIVYWLIGLVFLVAALLSLGYGLYAVGDQALGQMFAPAGFSLHGLVMNGAGAQDIIALVSDLLLTLIIMEVLGTVVHHLQDGETTLRPFLFIGIISATRGVLAVGAKLSVSTYDTLSREEFVRDMVELGINALVIIALGIAMKLIGKFIEEPSTRRHRSRRERIRTNQSSAELSSTASPLGWRSRGSETRSLFVLMVVIVLVAVVLIGVLLTTGGLPKP